MYKGKLVVQALKKMDKGEVTDEEIKRIITLLKKEDFKKLKHDVALAPQWIAEIMVKALK